MNITNIKEFLQDIESLQSDYNKAKETMEELKANFSKKYELDKLTVNAIANDNLSQKKLAELIVKSAMEERSDANCNG